MVDAWRDWSSADGALRQRRGAPFRLTPALPSMPQEPCKLPDTNEQVGRLGLSTTVSPSTSLSAPLSEMAQRLAIGAFHA